MPLPPSGKRCGQQRAELSGTFVVESLDRCCPKRQNPLENCKSLMPSEARIQLVKLTNVDLCDQSVITAPSGSQRGRRASWFDLHFLWSGCRDLNPGPLVPQTPPGCLLRATACDAVPLTFGFANGASTAAIGIRGVAPKFLADC
jgi:hypothetical protein